MFDALSGHDEFEVLNSGPLHAAAHTEHRWTLATLFLAQNAGLVPRPCNLISFDSHMDNVDPYQSDHISSLVETRCTTENIINLCCNILSPKNDDWIVAAMQLGLVADAVVFGLHGKQRIRTIHDASGVEHFIVPSTIPGSALSAQHDLSDVIRRNEPDIELLWRILGWKLNEGIFSFDQSRPKTFITIDLDCFRMDWSDYLFPWPDEVYKYEFLELQEHGWTGGKFCDELISKAGFIDIAVEPGCCGSEEKAAAIFKDMNCYMFHGQLDPLLR